MQPAERGPLGTSPQSCQDLGQIVGTQGASGKSRAPGGKGQTLQGPLKREVHGPLHRLCKYPRQHFKLHAALPLLLRRQLDVCSHFQVMLPQRRQTQIHIKPRQSTENAILLGHTLMHTLLHALHHCICSKATKSDFQIICCFGLSAPLLATMSTAN